MEQSKYIVDYPRKSEFAEAAIIDVTHDYTRFVSCPKCGARVSGAYWARPREVVLTKQNFRLGKMQPRIRSNQMWGVCTRNEESPRFLPIFKCNKYNPTITEIKP